MVHSRATITQSAEETKKLGKALATDLITAFHKGRGKKLPFIVPVTCLYGPLGSGKTTFAQGFADELGFTGRLLSPTFIIVRRYTITKYSAFFYHIDLYRTDSRTFDGLGLAEILAADNAFVLIEWAEKLGALLPGNRVDVRFSQIAEGRHTVTIERYE